MAAKPPRTLPHDLTWMPLSDAPGDCPWSTPQAVLAGWSGVEPKMKSFVRALASCQGHDVARTEGRWYLRYRLGKAVFVGGQPAPDPQLPKHVVAAGRSLPADLRALYAVHDGFGLHDDLDEAPPAWEVVDALQPVAELEVLSAVCGRTPQGVPDEDPESLLAFLVEGAGERLGIYKQYAGNPYKDAMRWDHETHEVAKVGPVLTVLARTWLAKLS